MSNELSKLNPSKADMLELLDGLREQVQAGRLKGLVFALVDPRAPDSAIVDAWGPHDIVEIACRKTVENIAVAAHAFNPELAKAIRAGIQRVRTN